jgi:preprotein translocase subunit YajC
MHYHLLMFMAPQQGGDGLIGLLFPLLLIIVFYVFLIRPQSKKQKEIQRKVEEMKKGDKVITNGGIMGTVNSIENDQVLVEVDTNVKIRFVKSAVVDVNPGK